MKKIERELNGRFPESDLRVNGSVYLSLFLDLDTPLENHLSFEIIPKVCNYHSEKGTKFGGFLRSSYLWQDCIIEQLEVYCKEQPISVNEREMMEHKLHKRIVDLQLLICNHYCDFTQSLIEQKEQRISELHQDRLQLLGQMAASMAHELKNPLFAIEGFLKLIQSDLSDDSRQKVGRYIEIVQNEFQRLYGHITGFLSFSKNNGTEEPFITCNIKEVIEAVLELKRPRLIDENVELEVQKDYTFTIVVQKVGLQQVLVNLISNAIDALQSVDYKKFIKINLSEDSNCHYISIFDNGPGIKPDLRDKLFEPFTTGKSNGTGLGLSICKQIIEKNNGNLTFASRPGETTFVISLKKSVLDF